MPWKNQGGGPWGSGPKGPWGQGPQSVGPRPPDLEDLLFEDRDGANLSTINVDPLLDPLHGDRRFEALVQKVVGPKAELKK